MRVSERVRGGWWGSKMKPKWVRESVIQRKQQDRDKRKKRKLFLDDYTSMAQLCVVAREPTGSDGKVSQDRQHDSGTVWSQSHPRTGALVLHTHTHTPTQCKHGQPCVIHNCPIHKYWFINSPIHKHFTDILYIFVGKRETLPFHSSWWSYSESFMPPLPFKSTVLYTSTSLCDSLLTLVHSPLEMSPKIYNLIHAYQRSASFI